MEISIMETQRHTEKHIAEAVSMGHPDKIADQIADSVLDLYLSHDPKAHVACEVLVTKDEIILAGEVSSSVQIFNHAIENAVRDALSILGYEKFGWDVSKVKITNIINTQSPDIAQAVADDGDTVNAGDQGVMIGYATDESPDFLPLAKSIANAILADLREADYDILGPDAKCIVTMEYPTTTLPYITDIIVSTQHTADALLDEVFSMVTMSVFNVIKRYSSFGCISIYDKTTLEVNPGGAFIIGGPLADTGLTGRKIIADTYGDYTTHGGGAFSGKDATKVDRSAAYYARYIAKNIVANGFASKAEVKLAYSIGEPYPKVISLNTFGTNTTDYDDDSLIYILTKHDTAAVFDCSVSNIRKELGLSNPIFLKTARYGHFGNDELPWEKVFDIQL